jgi:ArsR family transcriptional regulator
MRMHTSPSANPVTPAESTVTTGAADESETVFATAAELFGLLSTPIRLKIISSLCNGEKNVSQLLGDIDTTQPNMSQHLSTLYRAGVLGKRRDATQIYYRIESERAAMLCRAVCTQIAFEMDAGADVGASERLLPTGARPGRT